ncbi:MAG: xanthine dehydrogenase family protein [Acidimicrobiaceae bacterium]|nr:xanthine dehydrogenase family protein [Acidimicrobiaceae bacterium]
MAQAVAERYTGSSVKRVEDARILTGRGTYVDDIKLPNMVYAAFLRSPLAHARVTSVDVTAALEAPGVLAVYTGADLEPLLTPGPYGAGAILGAGAPTHSCLATDKVRLVGDLVALVVAESRPMAEDAAELIEVDYDDLPAVATAERALDPSSPPIFEDLGSNVLVPPSPRTYGDVDAAFAEADRVLQATLHQHRHQNVPMETRGCVASYDAETGQLLVWSANQSVGYQRDSIAARLGMEPDQVRVRTADVGGSFGLKINASREDVAVAAASRALGRPIKYIEDRYEHLTATGQAREESFDVEVACSNEGDILGLKVKMVIDTGAYPGLGGALPYMIESMVPGPYKVRGYQFEFTAVVTNKATYVAYRGPWAAETFVRERVFDLVAHELGLEPLEVRRRNVTAGNPDAAMITGRSLRGITVAESLERVAGLVDLPDFRRRQQAARAEGRHLGIGFASYIEAAPGPKNGDDPLGAETMRMYLDDDGMLVVVTGQMPHGQGHETTLRQVAADEFGVAFEDVRMVLGDSDVVPKSLTGGSRAATMAGGAALTTARALKSKVLEAASQLFEASPSDLRIDRGSVLVAGVPAKAMSVPDVARSLREADGEVDLSVEHTYDGGAGGWAGGTHCALVEVDIETGLVHVDRYVVAEDCGELINPAVVDGQIRGGVAQGIGAVLLERSAYDDDGNYLSATFMDYLMPTTMDIPRIEISHLATVPLDADVNFRGVGEGGMIVAPVTMCNAIEDALSDVGVRVYEQHLPPARLLELAGVVAGD